MASLVKSALPEYEFIDSWDGDERTGKKYVFKRKSDPIKENVGPKL